MKHFQAGPALRKQAIERTRRHIDQHSRGRTDLTKALQGGEPGCNARNYLAQEAERLAKLERGL